MVDLRVKVFDAGFRYKPCRHKHKLQGTAVFFQSLGFLICVRCDGQQAIKKPLD